MLIVVLGLRLRIKCRVPECSNVFGARLRSGGGLVNATFDDLLRFSGSSRTSRFVVAQFENVLVKAGFDYGNKLFVQLTICIPRSPCSFVARRLAVFDI